MSFYLFSSQNKQLTFSGRRSRFLDGFQTRSQRGKTVSTDLTDYVAPERFDLEKRWATPGQKKADLARFRRIAVRLAGAGGVAFAHESPDGGHGENILRRWLEMVGRECGAIGAMHEVDWDDIADALSHVESGNLGKPQRRLFLARSSQLADQIWEGSSSGPLPRIMLFSAAFTLLEQDPPLDFALPGDDYFEDEKLG